MNVGTRSCPPSHRRRRADARPGSFVPPRQCRIESALRLLTLAIGSGRRDLNSRPRRPKRRALPGCATPRRRPSYRQQVAAEPKVQPESATPWSRVQDVLALSHYQRPEATPDEFATARLTTSEAPTGKASSTKPTLPASRDRTERRAPWSRPSAPPLPGCRLPTY